MAGKLTMPVREGYSIKWQGHGCAVTVRHDETGMEETEGRSLSMQMNADLAIDRIKPRLAKLSRLVDARRTALNDPANDQGSAGRRSIEENGR